MSAAQVWVRRSRVVSRPPQTTGNVSVPAIPLQILARCGPASTPALEWIRKHGVPASPRHTAAVAPSHTAPRLHFGSRASVQRSGPRLRLSPGHSQGPSGSPSLRLGSSPAARHAGRSVSPWAGSPSCLLGQVLRPRDSGHAQSVRGKPFPRRAKLRTAS